MTHHILDAVGLNCPMPIIKAKIMLKSIPSGDVLEVRATDPGSVADFAAFCRQTGHELVSSTSEGDVFKFEIRHV